MSVLFNMTFKNSKAVQTDIQIVSSIVERFPSKIKWLNESWAESPESSISVSDKCLVLSSDELRLLKKMWRRAAG